MALSTVAGEVEARRSTLSGLTEQEAKEFNTIFILSFLIFTAVVIVAHILTWMWRPWLPSVSGYRAGTAFLDGAGAAAHGLIMHLV
jgi:light-harvesting complex 1 beta chain